MITLCIEVLCRHFQVLRRRVLRSWAWVSWYIVWRHLVLVRFNVILIYLGLRTLSNVKSSDAAWEAAISLGSSNFSPTILDTLSPFRVWKWRGYSRSECCICSCNWDDRIRESEYTDDEVTTEDTLVFLLRTLRWDGRVMLRFCVVFVLQLTIILSSALSVPQYCAWQVLSPEFSRIV